ncbi:MAG TPA: C40 family peptidase [Methylomusa anaerophila]|uniref:Gamma-D-glutamyl-L-lysine endopeptidase n=1 Tax=Methylomusa anaerophila TaxID=1930071 RepID=A0A348AMB8_9FIRM|nr:C40 family peptidase [Methylomusa anaerophila]BBB92216.1 gamma-D-glutamyl-L-lysine endopeptidase [Methylomusa anaerophila]HML87771.1 C40 family peptidase [Methylomusa anaerophila]
MEQHARQMVSGAINVPLAIFWSNPDAQYRKISLAAAVNPTSWSQSLDVQQRLWLVNKVNTMAIYGERVTILDGQNNWLQVAAMAQRTKDNKWGQAGWVPENQISYNSDYLVEQSCLPQAVVSIPKAALFWDTTCWTQPINELSFQVRLPILLEEKSVFKVRLPDGGTGHVSRLETKKVSELFFSRECIVAQARQFLGLRYLWGGTSCYGFDCSGYTFRLYQSQGISLYRNSKQQSQEGIPIEENNLLPGDLVFFASEGGKGNIHHVGMCVGNGIMIHAPQSRSAIQESRFDIGHYHEEYWGGRRYVYC